MLVSGFIAACSGLPTSHEQVEPDAIFTVHAPGQRHLARVLTQADRCPQIQFEGQAVQDMAMRVAPANLPPRDKTQADSQPTRMPVRTCEALWPPESRSARVLGREVPAPRAEIRRVLLIADTGCRMKASDNAFQDCNDSRDWPFAQIARSAAAKAPDLVVHLGDMHYRESPCPSGRAGCAGSPWGYGYDTWRADFFEPAKPLLAAAPWLFVRGNHEACNRAGQGWFRFIDAAPWQEARSCNDPALDALADYSDPWAFKLSADTQLLVFDSSRTSFRPFSPKDLAWARYSENLARIEALTRDSPVNFFLSHHPLLAFDAVEKPDQIKPGGNAGLQSVMAARQPKALFPPGISVAMHGHVHLFESLSFASGHPATLVLGHGGSAPEGVAPATVPAGATPWPGAVLEHYTANSDYGFATLDREPGGWLLTSYDTQGKPVLSCQVAQGKSRCRMLAAGSP